jgi:ferredoxin
MTTIGDDDKMWWVTVKIIDSTGAEMMQFPATKIGSFSEDAEKAWYEIPTSCRAGACFVCAWHIKKWEEHVDIWKVSVPLIDIDEDQVLMCVWWAKESCFVDGEDIEIIIEKDL